MKEEIKSIEIKVQTSDPVKIPEGATFVSMVTRGEGPPALIFYWRDK